LSVPSVGSKNAADSGKTANANSTPAAIWSPWPSSFCSSKDYEHALRDKRGKVIERPGADEQSGFGEQTRRLGVSLDERSAQRLDDLKQKCGISNDSALVRHALHIFHVLSQNKLKGNTVFIRDKATAAEERIMLFVRPTRNIRPILTPSAQATIRALTRT
jgi:hypothetical protein